jgi:starch phosphorylase
MKAALNGALNVSTLDGWWVEGYSEKTGFKIGYGEEYDNVEVHDKMDSQALYNVLEREVIPLFYDRNENDLPVEWIAKMKAAIHMAGQRFSAHRMLMDYTHHFYIPAVRTGDKMKADGFKLTKEVTAWVERIAGSWNEIAITDVEIPDLGETVYVGQKIPVRMKVHLGKITPDDVRVEVVSGRINAQDQLQNFMPIRAEIESDQGEAESRRNGVYLYAGELECSESGRFGVTARVVPKNENLVHTRKPKLISWW